MNIEKLTVIPIDKTVILNGVALNNLEFYCDENVHAFHFKGGVSIVEYINGKGTEIIEGFDIVQDAIDAWTARQEEIQAMQEEAEIIALAKEEVQPVIKVTLEEKITAILKQFDTDRFAGKDLIPDLDAIVTEEMKG
jgi:hypothetical protein